MRCAFVFYVENLTFHNNKFYFSFKIIEVYIGIARSNDSKYYLNGVTVVWYINRALKFAFNFPFLFLISKISSKSFANLNLKTFLCFEIKVRVRIVQKNI